MDSVEACIKCGEQMNSPSKFPWALSCSHKMCLQCIDGAKATVDPQQKEFIVHCRICQEERQVDILQLETQMAAIRTILEMEKMKIQATQTGQTIMGHKFVCSRHQGQPINCLQYPDNSDKFKLLCQKCIFEKKVDLSTCVEIDERGLKEKMTTIIDKLKKKRNEIDGVIGAME